MNILKQSTQIKVRVGPFVDATDGVTPETTVALGTADQAELLKADGAATVDLSAATWAAVTGADGWYDLTLTTSHTDTVGELVVVVQDSSLCLPVFGRFQVMEEATYDALYGASAAGFDSNGRVDVGSWLGTAVTTSSTTAKPEVDVNSVSDDATAANNLELDYDGTGYDKSNSTIGTCTTNTDMRGTDSALLASSAPTNFGDLAITVTTGQVTVGTNNDKTGYSISGTKTTLDDLNDVSTAEVNTQVDTALTDIHLDHLLAADYDPAAKPGTSTALLNELVENDGGVSRFTSNALEQAPTGGTNPNVLVDTTIAVVNSQTSFTLTAGSDQDDAYNDQAIVVYDASNSDYPSIRKVSDYVGSTKTVTIDSAPDFTIIAGDGAKAFVTAPGTTAPTAAQVADAVWDETAGDHTTAGTFGEQCGTDIDAILTDTNELQADDVPGLISALNDPTAAAIADAVWDETLTGSNHNTATSAGRRLRELSGTAIRSETAQAGSGNSITLDASASATDNIYDNNLIVITGGTGVGQTRIIVEYDGTTKVATVDQAWETNPDVTSEFQIIADQQLGVTHHGIAQAGTASTITLSASASAQDDIYLDQVILIRTSTGTGQSRTITAYNGTTKVATVSPDWHINPTSNSVYAIMPAGRVDVGEIAGESVTATATVDFDDLAAILTDTGTTLPNTLGTPAGADLAADVAAVKSDTAAVLVDTGTTLDTKINTIDTVVDGIKTKTDSLTFTIAGNVDANIQHVNDIQVTGDGQAGTEWGPA